MRRPRAVPESPRRHSLSRIGRIPAGRGIRATPGRLAAGRIAPTRAASLHEVLQRSLAGRIDLDGRDLQVMKCDVRVGHARELELARGGEGVNEVEGDVVERRSLAGE